jgi:lipoate-protein ligase B
LQRSLFKKRLQDKIADQLLLLEHFPVITLGRSARKENLINSSEQLEKSGIELVETDRGGDVTYHGPGQLVGYPILSLQPGRMDVLRYLRDLEEVLIRVLDRHNIKGGRNTGYTGVWIGNRKIASIGVKISRWVTYHGFALNVSTDLSAFDLIVPCGIPGVEMTSMERENGCCVNLDDVARAVDSEMSSIFGGGAEATNRTGPNNVKNYNVDTKSLLRFQSVGD